MKLRYFSHSAFLITFDNGIRVLIDPFLTGNPTAPVTAEEVQAEFILVTHGHGDHLGDTLSIADRCNSLCICENELSTYLSSKGLNAHPMHIGGSGNFDFGKIKIIPALHSSVTPDQECVGAATGFILFIQDKIICHLGDTGLSMEMKLLGELYNIDYLLVPIGDNFTMGIEDAVTACTFIKPKCAVPMHYNTFDIIQADPEVFKTKAEAQGISCTVLKFGEEINL
ncbi:MAG: metal-dependent hydrolase [Desulfobacula sp.]|nr:metal-dependent hydrolase [Desulfobacula sp.]